ncbi:MAG: HDOD domain-containing protein [Candidatus Zixiibacteriota bacterium]
MSIRDRIVARVTSFTTLPAVAHKLMSLLDDPEADPAEMAKIIQLDPALTANVLKAANSAFLGFTRPVTTVTEADFRIGTKWMFQIALSSLVFSSLKTPARGYDLSAEDLWRHSIAVALMAENLCRLLNIKDSGAIFTSGLIHDIGKIAMQGFVDDYFEELQHLAEGDDIAFEEAESKLLGTDHAEVGALIAEKWRFPQSIVDDIRWHHNPEGAPEPQEGIDIVHISDAMCLMEGFGLGRDGLQYRMCYKSILRLKLTSQVMEAACSQLLLSIKNAENMFSGATASPAVARR